MSGNLTIEDRGLVNRIVKYAKRSDRLDTVMKSSGFSFSTIASLTSIIISAIMIVASILGVYLASNALITDDFHVSGVTFSKELIKWVIVGTFSIIYVAFEFLKTTGFNAFLSSFTYNGAFLLVSILLMGVGHFEEVRAVFNIGNEFNTIFFWGGFALFILSNAIMIHAKKKPKEWFVVLGILAVVALTTITVQANIRTVDIVDKREIQNFKAGIENLSSVKEAKSDKSTNAGLLKNIMAQISDLRDDTKEAKNHRDSEIKRIRKDGYGANSQAIKDAKWRYTSTKMANDKALRRLNEQTTKQNESYASASDKLTATKVQEEASFDKSRVKYYNKAFFIAVWGEVVCSFFIFLSVMAHILNPNIKGVSTIQEDITETRDNDIDIKKLRSSGGDKSKLTKVKDAIVGKLQPL